MTLRGSFKGFNAECLRDGCDWYTERDDSRAFAEGRRHANKTGHDVLMSVGRSWQYTPKRRTTPEAPDA